MRLSVVVGGICALLMLPVVAFGQANGKLQIHHMDVGQGDGAVLISPKGQVVLFDAGKDMKTKSCTKALSYLDQLGIQKVDALFVSHYHYDHIGCVPAVLAQFPLKGTAYDRGGSYDAATFTAYAKATKNKRKTAQVGDQIILDKTSGDPVTITIVAVNGKSQTGDVSTSNENDLSLAAVVSYGSFREEIGGDLSGENTDNYEDVETPVAMDVGHVDVYKVHHHCSEHSTNTTWLKKTTPTVGIISTGDGNSYDHPATKCLDRLRTNGLKKVYWTEKGNGGAPKPGFDLVRGNILVEIPSGGAHYFVDGDKYEAALPIAPTILANSGASPETSPAPDLRKFAWSSKSQLYHLATCRYVSNISKANYSEGDIAPPGKTLHKDCVGGQD